MAKIPLKSYTREIESLIESGQIDEAIAHCRHILKSFPKHVDTYRLLGKAFLEAQRYGDAADIFQRVLSSVPEDFVSQVGMSIIREDEGNLDQAIWHMERAFEMQPSNNAIQEELRRLYGKRDGFEPPKVRLTRGALARMYVKGDLYQQAIAELRAALAEDPPRIDLLALLAHVYFKTGQRVDAAETSSAVLRKLPYNLEANRILAEVLSDSERSEEAAAYRQRLQALDPYSAHTGTAASTPEKAPEQDVLIEELDWFPGMPGQPEWAASLGVDLGDLAPDQEPLPGWLSAADEEPTGKGAAVFVPPDQPDPEEHVPDWMKSAGWSAIPGSAEETEAQLETEDLNAPEPVDELADAEIPDWLQAMVPGDETSETRPEAMDEDFSWLMEASNAGAESQAPIIENLQPEVDGEETSHPERDLDQTDEVPDWLADRGAVTELAGHEPQLTSLEESSEAEGEEPATEAEAAQEAELPEWLGELSAATESEVLSSEDAPDWLSKNEAAEAEALPAEELPEWLQETQAEAKPEGVEAAAPAETTQADIPDWLQDLEGEPLYEGDTKPVRVTRTEEPAEPTQAETEAEIEAEAASAETAPAEVVSEEAQEAEAAPMAPLPGWLVEEEADTAGETASPEEAAVETAPMSPLPDWLAEPEAEPGEQPAGEEIAPAEAWEPGGEAAPAEEAQPEGQMGALAFEVEDADAGYAWLESLAAKQGAEEGMLLSPEDRLETPPDWVQEAIEGTEQPELEAQAPGEPVEQPQAEAAFEEEVPTAEIDEGAEQPEIEAQFAEEPVEESQAEAALTEEIPASELPDWLAEVDEGTAQPEMEAQFPEEPIEELRAEAGLTEETSAAELPDWLAELEEGAEQEAVPADELPDWLRGEAAESAVEAEALPAEELPEWLQETQAEAEPEGVEAAAPAETTQADIPDWLQDLEGEPLYEGDTKPVRVTRTEEPAEPTQAETEAEIEAEAATQEAAAETEPLPDWLAEPEAEPEEQPAGEEVAPAEAWEPGGEATPAFQAEEPSLEEAQPEEVMGALAFEVEDADAGYAWLESLAAKQGAEEGMLLSPEDRLETPPDWVQEAIEESGQPEPEAQAPGEPVEEPQAEAGLAEEVPAAEIDEGAIQPGVAEFEQTAEEPEAAVPELPEWLRDIAEAGEDEVVPAESEAQPEAPAWVQEEQDTEHLESETEAELGEPVIDDLKSEIEDEKLELPGWLAEEEPEFAGQEQEWTPPEIAPHEAQVQKIDLNQASLAELEKIPGIGFVMAQQIIGHREYHGPYSSVEDLQQVFGFSPSQFETIKDYLQVEGPQPEIDLVLEESEPQVQLASARNALVQGNLEEAIEEYTGLIKAHMFLPDIIRDLHEALYRYPVDISIWQAMGDAYLRNDQLQEALDAYIKAEELLR